MQKGWFLELNKPHYLDKILLPDACCNQPRPPISVPATLSALAPQLEGAVQAGEGRVRAQAAELEAVKARARGLEVQLEAAQVGRFAL